MRGTVHAHTRIAVRKHNREIRILNYTFGRANLKKHRHISQYCFAASRPALNTICHNECLMEPLMPLCIWTVFSGSLSEQASRGERFQTAASNP
ncbi:unnamed protein product [Gadus morhua 'NCC']